MNMKILLAELRQQGVIVQIHGEQLRIKSQISPIPDAIVQKLKLHKQQLVAYFKELNGGGDEIQKCLLDEAVLDCPISVQQWSLWPLYKMGNASHYNIPLCYDLAGDINQECLIDALHQVYRHFDALHSVFVEEGEHVYMRSKLRNNWSVDIIQGDETDVIEVYKQEQERHFELTHDALFVARLICISPSHIVLIMNFPHIIVDGWSIDRLWSYLSKAYQRVDLPPPKLDYRDVLFHQAKQECQQGYWQARLQGYEPFNWHSLSRPNKHGTHLKYSLLSDSDCLRLKDYAKSAQVSTFSAALYFWTHTISDFTGQDDLVISVPYANREQSQLQDVVGYLVSMIPIRIHRQVGVRDLQAALHRDFAAAQCDFNALLSNLGLLTEAGRHPLQQVVFAWHDGLVQKPCLDAISASRRETELNKAKFPLSLSVSPLGNSFQLKWEYDPAILSADTVERLENLFLRGLRKEPCLWPELPDSMEQNTSVLTVLAEQVLRHPNKVAVSADDESLTYSELWKLSQCAAAQLQQHGVVAAEAIGVQLPKGIELSVAIIAITMAGAVYVPLAEDDSLERLERLALQCEMRYCITKETKLEGLTALSMSTLLVGEDSHYHTVSLIGTSPLYINFSSGTTGEPKGIRCMHQGVLRLVKDADYVTLDSYTHLLCAATQTFDAFTFEFWGALLNGGTLHLVNETQLTCDKLRWLIQMRAVNTIWLTAALFHTLVDIDVRAFIGLKQLLVGGDVVSPDHIRRIYAADPNVVAINGYGPTENTTFSCCFTIPRDWSWEDALPLGKAINGTQVCLLSKTGTPVAKGCVGEIVVTGLGVANGYLEPTQETGKFYDLRTSKGSYRAYRTGDLGYEDSNGLIRFLGRADQQVKINGFRVELEAIDRVLTDQVNVSQSVTLAIKQGNIQQLVSFVIVEQVVSNNCEVGELRSLLATILPVYMVPNVILALPLLPVTSNGKVDRKLLLEKYFSWQMGGNGEQRPFTIKEQQVADVWLSVLGTVSLGPQSHFFQVGGNSLLALKIASRLEQRLGQKINLIDLIKRPVLEQLAAFLEEEWAPQSQSIPYLSITEKTSGVPISVQQWSLWPLYKMGRAAEYNVLVSYDLLGHVNVPHLSNALYSVYCGFDALHSQFIESGEHVLMAPCVHKDWSATVTHGDEALVQSLYKQELQRDFDLTSGPVFIAHIVSLSLDHHILIMNFPHIVIDGWSIEQLWLYIDQSYQQLPQTTPKLGFCDYLGHSANLPSNVDYWLQRLQGYQPFQWHSASPLLVQDASNRRFLLSERDTSALQHRAEKEQTSLFCTALYLWAQTVAEYTGQNDVVVSTPYANREHRQLLSLVGYLVAMVPVRYQQGMRLTDFQQELHQDFVAAQCDFNALLPSLGLNTEGGRHPLQQTVFSWQDGLLSKPSLADLSVKYRESEATGAKFPLSLSISPNGGSYELKWDYDPLIISTNTLLLIEDLFLTKLRSQTTPWPKRTVIPADNNVLDALYQQVEERGKTIAVYAGSEHLSYDQLWCQARRLAAQLQHLGVKAGDKVGVRLSRNCNLSIALVGIVMAGAIYVPLADDESSERLLILIKQSQMTLCLSDAPVSPSISCWFVDELLTAPELEYRNVSLSGHSPIYVNFSSGTTGEPKGILCTHQGVYRLVKEADYISLSSNTRMLCAAIPTFDAFTLEFWGPLLNGGALHMLMKPQLDCGALKDFIQVDGVNTLWLTAALFHTLVDIDVNAFLGGRQLLVGGDVVSPDHVRRVYAADHNIEIVNGYGPTENTTFTCCYRIPRDWPVDEALPIGYPVNGTQVYILDKTAQPVAAGCIGEIVVIGQGLAAGYLNPTQEEGRFITLQTPEGVCRAYCTGDLGYVDAMGRVRFIGRADQQVKINGFRVELEAINRVLSGLHEVCRGETLAFKQNDVQHLVSFVQREDSNEEVYEALDLIPDIAKVLPSYMVPRTVLALDHLPMTHNGKVDRKKLMTVYLEWSQNRELLHPIETDTERLIADVWQDVLGLRIQGRQSHFYQSGGNSIMLLKVHAILMDRLEREIPLNLCLQHVILYELAHVIDLLLQPTEIYDPEIEIKEGISYPLSNEQLRLYLTQQLYPGTAYNVPCYIRLPKNIQMSQVRHLIISLLEAHPALRMRISEEKGEIKQCLLAPSDVVITWLNTSHLSFFALKEQISLETIEVDVCVSRIQVIDVEGEEVWLALNIHHIGIDGQSINTLLESIDTILSGKSLALDDGFIRHVMWQKSEEYESAVAQEVVYWRERLSSLSAPTVLPYLEMPNASHKAAYVDMVLDTRLITGAERLSRRLGVSEFTLWSGILSLVLGRLNQTTFATIATPVAKRLHRTESKSIGFFANTLMLYSKWSDNLRVDDFLKSRQQLITRDLCHPLVALDTLLLLQKEQEKQIDTLSEVLFTLTRPDDASRINMGRNSDVKFHFGLTLSLGNTEALAQIEYLECAYNEAMIYSVLDALIWCVEQIIADPGILIGDIKLIQDEPKTLQQEEVKQTKCLPELIMQVAKLQPNAIALSDKDEQIDYETLVKLANQIGASLQEMGVKKGDRVAVLISRRAVLPVTLLGILLAGAVYVPLDPEYPLARNQYILEDARPRIVIYESQRLISNSFPFEWLSLSELESVSPNNTWHPVKIEEDDVSHLIYTSGSTGSPKGVVIRHGGVSALQSWASDTYKREDLALVYGATSICFDLSVFEIFITWSLGGRLHFANNALQLLDDLPILPITLINTVPSVLLEVLKYQSITPDIRVINLAGEPLPSSLAATIFKQSGRVRIFNLYGPSEDTTYSTCYPVERDNYERMLIGSPLPGTQVLICDTKGRPLPDYFTGELYLAGKGLAKGYWNKPELSHEKFVHIPQLGTCYKTGDLVRRIENQQLAYVGRIDDQVKLRGFRIELGEIDNLIQMDPRVAESCTLLIESDGFKQIVSFIVCSISVFELDDIRQILATKLPQYMVPSYLHMIEKMPTTPSGKLDKKALKALCQVQGEEDATNWHKYSSYVKWCYEQYRELFPLTSFKVDDDFFGLGGNSLLAVTLVNRVRSKFGIEIRIKDLFLFSNAIKLGSVIEEQLKKQSTTMDEEIVF